MQYTDTITKRFLTAETQSDGTLNARGKSNMSDYQDPTYMGFMIRLVTSTNSIDDYDSLPHGLFTDDPEANPYSTYNYLKSRGEFTRASYILQFEKKFRALVDECPWYFIKISGLADSWKVEPAKTNWRGSGKKLVIDTLESIDLKITYLLDLYRKAVFDFNFMRYAVPDHMRFFKMDVIVSEVRPMKISTFAYDSLTTDGHYSGGDAHKFTSEETNFSTSFSELENNAAEYRGLMDTGAPWTAGTFIKFSYEHCEIDVFANAPAFLDSVGITPETLAINKITINTGVIKERNVYGLLGAIIEDTLQISDYENVTSSAVYPAIASPATLSKEAIEEGLPNYGYVFEPGELTRNFVQEFFNNGLKSYQGGGGPIPNTPDAVKASFTGTSRIQGGAGSRAARDQRQAERQANRTADGTGTLGHAAEVPRRTPDTSGASTAAGSSNGNPVGNAVRNIGRSAQTGLQAAAENAIRTQVNRALLGNVYGVSPLSLIGSAQSIINNPVAAITAILQKHSSPQIGAQIAKKVQLTGAEISLVSNIIGEAAAITAQAVPNPSAASASDQGKGTIGKTNLQAFASAASKPGKVNLESNPVPPTTLGKSNFS